MKVYENKPKYVNGYPAGITTLYVAPSFDDPTNRVPEWWEDRDMIKPRNVEVRFINGVAEVPDNLGRYLLDKNLARKTRPLIQAA